MQTADANRTFRRLLLQVAPVFALALVRVERRLRLGVFLGRHRRVGGLLALLVGGALRFRIELALFAFIVLALILQDKMLSEK